MTLFVKSMAQGLVASMLNKTQISCMPENSCACIADEPRFATLFVPLQFPSAAGLLWGQNHIRTVQYHLLHRIEIIFA